MDETQTRRLRCGALALLTIPLGIACRMAPLGLPAAVVKYGGSALWAAMLYWLVALVFPRRTCRWLALGASTLAVCVEFFKLVRTPALDAFRGTLPGKLLLGRFFSWWDIACYLLAIGFVCAMDATARRSPVRPRATTLPR